MSLRGIARATLAAAVLPATALAQLCPIPFPCNGTQIVCHHQNGIRNHRGFPATPKLGPNAATGNVPGDAEWKIWACGNGMTRGAIPAHFANWEIGVFAGSCDPGPCTAWDIPDLELRSVVVAGGLKEPDLATPPIFAAVVGTISLPLGMFRINVSVQAPTVAVPASCTVITSLPTLSNADVAMLFLLTAGEVAWMPTYWENVVTNTEVNTISNPSVPPGTAGNSYSGTYDALAGAMIHYAINDELFAEMGFYEPTLEIYRMTTGFAVPTRGSGARELASGDSFFLRSEDWEAGTAAMNGQDRLAAVVISEGSAGNPLCLAPPGNPPGFLAGSAFLPGSTGMLALYPSAMTIGFLPLFTATMGVGLNCHVVGDVACGASGLPSVFTDMQATTATIPIPAGLSGQVLYAAAFYLNLATLTIDDGSNTVELLFL